MKADELREKYLAFFQTKGHARKESDVLVPTWDPSVLFTPAGMNQFKDHFLGKVKLDFTRATTCQKCLRTGDIDNVGRTAYHHTFFEMLGNFSFGDYFKRDAITWAWEFLTKKSWLGLNPDQLSVTVYLDDDEAAKIWRDEIGVPESRIERMGEDDNFWPAGAPTNGPDGVCGPCSEIFFHPAGGKPVEIWNLVFTQFNRVGSPPNNLRPLPSKNIDTGMGLERTAAVLQGVDTNFHIDILRPIVEAAAEVCGVQYEPASDNGRRLRRITDHVRACTFAVHENVYPGPNKEKYVIRRLLRRAVLDGHRMGVHEPFLHRLVPVVVESMKNPYPELRSTAERVANVIRQEETAFFGTIDAGLARIQKIFEEMRREDRVIVGGEEAAELYQTYGVPAELVENMAAEHTFTFDWTGFRAAMERHGVESGKAQFEVFKTGPIESLKTSLLGTEFVGYETTEAAVVVKGIVAENVLQQQWSQTGENHPAIVVLDRTPFYGESGGQVGDSGEIRGSDFVFRVLDTQKDADLFLHYGYLVEGKLRPGTKGNAVVDSVRRDAIRRAHSATHILHHALRKHLGSHAQQQGSKVDADWLRFDFTNLAPVDQAHLLSIEQDVLGHIASAEPVRWQTVTLGEARASGAMMLFGEKYPDPVRMVSMGEFSKELCGGTHLTNTQEVGEFEIISEEGVSAGTRRIVALTGAKAKEHEAQIKATLEETAAKLGVNLSAVPDAVRDLVQRVRELRKQLTSGGKSTAPSAPASAKTAKKEPSYREVRQALREVARMLNVSALDVPARVVALAGELQDLHRQIERMAQSGELSADTLLERGEKIGTANLVVAEVPGGSPNLLRTLIDQIRKKVDSSAIFLAAPQEGDKVLLVAGVSRELVAKGLSAGEWVREVAPIVGGGGGGKPDLAQAGGKQPEKLPEALDLALKSMRAKLTAGQIH